MLHNIIETVLPVLISLIEIVGIIVILFGSAKAFYGFIRNTFRGGHYRIKYVLCDHPCVWL